MAFKRGEVLLVPFPSSDLSATKVRPALVISSNEYQRNEPDVILAAITSNIGAAKGRFDYVLKDWRGAGLKFPSAFKPVIFTLDPGRVKHRVGAVAKSDLAEIDKRLKTTLSL
jgi:mRNA interferase MazF